MDDTVVKYQYHQAVYVFHDLLSWLKDEVPPDDLSIISHEPIGVIQRMIEEYNIESELLNSSQVMVIVSHTLKTVNRQAPIKILCRFVKIPVPFSAKANFAGYISYGKAGEINAYLEDKRDDLEQHKVIYLPRS